MADATGAVIGLVPVAVATGIAMKATSGINFGSARPMKASGPKLHSRRRR